jgi:Rad3-related DNA helicase
VLFSATLAPAGFYADTLGLPADTAWVDVEAPFSAEQLSVQVVRSVSTRFARRGASLAPIARLIADQYAARPGNYLAFFSSFDYLDQVAAELARSHPGIPWWAQSRRMPAPERERFLARFTPESSGIGFAVLGGLFAEGVDLPGERLIGAFIATLARPRSIRSMGHVPPSAGGARPRPRLHLPVPGHPQGGAAAGRVIRTPTDRGSIHLIDDRFAWPQVLGLLPDWWHRWRAGARVSSLRLATPRRPVTFCKAPSVAASPWGQYCAPLGPSKSRFASRCFA